MVTVYKSDGNVEFYEYATFDGNVYSTAKITYYNIISDEDEQCYDFYYEPYLWEVTNIKKHSLHLSNDMNEAMKYALSFKREE